MDAKPFRCAYEGCNKTYSLKHHLRRHTEIIHLGSSNHKRAVHCEICKNSFSTKQNLQKHVARRHKVFPHECPTCGQGFPKETLLAQHLFMHTGSKSLKCKYCEQNFSNQTERCRHQSKHKLFECRDCEEKFHTRSQYMSHKEKNHPKSQETREEFRCDICGKTFRLRNYIIRHMKIHRFDGEKDAFLCPRCPKRYAYKSNLKHHMSSFHERKTYDCRHPNCRAKLSTQQRLKEHSRTHLRAAAEPIKKPKIRKVRKDRGIIKTSMAEKLVGVVEKIERFQDSDASEPEIKLEAGWSPTRCQILTI